MSASTDARDQLRSGPAADNIYLGLGSNLGDRKANLKRAIALLGEDFEIGRVSPIYETAPVGPIEQRDFLNCALSLRSAASPRALLEALKAIELRMGRAPGGPRHGPRIIDIDILFYADRILDEPERGGRPALRIPHPEAATRAFVLVPLADIAPDLVHPVLGQRILALRAALDSQGG